MKRHIFYCFIAAILAFWFTSSLCAETGTQSAPKTAAKSVVKKPTPTIQVSAFKTLKEAEAESDRLKDYGIETFIRYEKVKNKGSWYRVYVGRFQDKSLAESYAEKLKTRGIISWFLIRSVKLPPGEYTY